ncbi:DUF7383 domain-containing protein [Candidatus Halobonum tyrrellensis]|uniref:Uncharacterized protein n=1 Tax=Candidatus Halobonum tyrrellensis G22 TaxID=1324957 RepID=V4HCC5_9EURY|nr:hypothetical protein [Candidatus Halobonum tyrrellensis]ESP87713.1 hypothetical protein K933_12870 [Candidatus Halobonum tyrrellensis G22]
MRTRATYASVNVGAQLAPEGRSLNLEWADDAGDRTDAHEFEVATADPRDAFLGVQAFDVSEYGHELLLNDDPLSGFDIPPGDGWQYWVDSVTGASLTRGTNTLEVARDTDTRDAFAVGTVWVNWKAPVDEE